MASDDTDNWEGRLSEQELFWLRYEWWEVEEVKCIYQLLVLSLAPDCQRETSGSGIQDSLEDACKNEDSHNYDISWTGQIQHYLERGTSADFSQEPSMGFLESIQTTSIMFLCRDLFTGVISLLHRLNLQGPIDH